jgi:hypothetical protein
VVRHVEAGVQVLALRARLCAVDSHTQLSTDGHQITGRVAKRRLAHLVHRLAAHPALVDVSRRQAAAHHEPVALDDGAEPANVVATVERVDAGQRVAVTALVRPAAVARRCVADVADAHVQQERRMGAEAAPDGAGGVRGIAVERIDVPDTARVIAHAVDVGVLKRGADFAFRRDADPLTHDRHLVLGDAAFLEIPGVLKGVSHNVVRLSILLSD